MSVTSASQGQTMSQGGNPGTLGTQTPKKRKVKFTDPELHVLVDTIMEHMGHLFGSKPTNAAGKASIWDVVVKKVNKEGENLRTLSECKKRWHDYKRKVKNIVDIAKSQATDLADILTKRQMTIAQFFKMDIEGSNSMQLPNYSFLDKDDNWDSEEDFTINKNEDISSSSVCLTVGRPEDECVPHSSADVSKQPFDHHKTRTFKESIQSSTNVSEQPSKHHKPRTLKEIIEPTSTELPKQQSPNWDNKLDQLIVQQQQTNEMLKIIQQNVSESLKLQKRTSRMLKTNFLELQKSIIYNQKTSSDQSRALEHTMKSLHAKMNEINNQLRVKQLQELMSSDESDLDIGTPQMLSTPLNKESASGKKKRLEQTPSSSGSLKKRRKKDSLNVSQTC